MRTVTLRHLTRLATLAILLLVIINLLTGCGVDLKEFNEHWTATVKDENQIESTYHQIEQDTNEGYKTITGESPLIDQCFKGSESVLQDGLAGKDDNNAGKQRPTGDTNTQTFFNAWRQAYKGDINRCQDLVKQVASDIRSWRQTKKDDFGKLWDEKIGLDTDYTGSIGQSMQTQFLQQAQDFARGKGVNIPSYVFPTFNLEAITLSDTVCGKFAAKFPNDVDQNVLGGCTLRAKAAYQYIFRNILDTKVQNSFDTGVDNLDLTQPTPAPTTKP